MEIMPLTDDSGYCKGFHRSQRAKRPCLCHSGHKVLVIASICRWQQGLVTYAHTDKVKYVGLADKLCGPSCA